MRLTKWIACDHPLRVNGLRDAKSIFSSDSEAVLFAWCQLGHPEASLGTGCGHSDPVSLAHITFLYNVVGDVAASILLWGVPQQSASIDVLLCDFQRSLRRSRDVCAKENTLIKVNLCL